MKNQLRVLTTLSVAVVVALVVAAPATAQIHEMEKSFNAAQPRLQAKTQHVASASIVAPFCSECIWLNMYDPSNTLPGDVIVHTAATLTLGATYLITIKGTYSVWPQGYWIAPGQGLVEAAPQYSSLGAQNWAAFADWEYLFGYYKPTTPAQPLPKPIVWNGISLDGGVTYNYLTPIGGHAFNFTHEYKYLVTGQGAQAFFFRHDHPTNDNSGMFKICVQQVTICGDISDPQ